MHSGCGIVPCNWPVGSTLQWARGEVSCVLHYLHLFAFVSLLVLTLESHWVGYTKQDCWLTANINLLGQLSLDIPHGGIRSRARLWTGKLFDASATYLSHSVSWSPVYCAFWFDTMSFTSWLLSYKLLCYLFVILVLFNFFYLWSIMYF